MNRLAAVVLVIVGAATSLASMNISRDISHTNDFVVLFPIELVLAALAGLAMLVLLLARRVRPAAVLDVGIYWCIMAAAFATVFPLWLPEDNTILGSAVLAGVLAAVGAGLALGSAALLAGHASAAVTLVASSGAALSFLVVLAGGVAYPLAQLRLPVIVTLVVVLLALRVAGRGRLPSTSSIALVVAGSLATIGLLIVRGPADWASASTSLKLYSFPILVLMLGMSALMLSTTKGPATAPNSSSAVPTTPRT